MNNKDVHFLSIDLEDWHTSAYLRHHLPCGKPISRIEQSTQPILDLLEKTATTATFFVLGSVAKDHPHLIKKIANAGHELASHGYSHTPLWQLNPDSFRSEIVNTNNTIENITGKKVKGFRAPYCSLDHSTAWMLPILETEGFVYDSSIFPMRTILYGVSGAPSAPYRIAASNILAHNPDSVLLEIPFTVATVAGIKIPCTGGVYGRVLPFSILRFLLKKTASRQPLNFYFHTWETDHLTPRISAPIFNRFVSYFNNGIYLNRVEKLLTEFHFSSFEKLITTLP
jgi:polysaccharide deacetylase family protein (PEP-CTERM system associated)